MVHELRSNVMCTFQCQQQVSTTREQSMLNLRLFLRCPQGFAYQIHDTDSDQSLQSEAGQGTTDHKPDQFVQLLAKMEDEWMELGAQHLRHTEGIASAAQYHNHM